MEIVIFLVIGCLFGFVLFKKNAIFINDGGCEKSSKLSVIIPARNEEKNLPVILSSLIKQTYQPFEIIVVDDGSVDQTQAVSESYGAKVIQNPALPLGWTGKTWAVERIFSLFRRAHSLSRRRYKALPTCFGIFTQ